jgi:aryl-alcohol dehydrogenase-like predicted oxidoreductase
MRLVAPRFDAASATDLLLSLYDQGVTSLHVSAEYDSWPVTCEAVRALRKARPNGPLEIVAKHAAPHFNETAFNPAVAQARIDELRRGLGVDRIDLVQWMVRHTPNDDDPRLDILRRDAALIEDAWSAMKGDGAVGALAVFPYSIAFLVAAKGLPWVDGVVDYLNLLELDEAPHLDGMAAAGKGFAAIRPMAAGKLADRAEEALAFPLLHPATASVIVTASSPANIDMALTAARTRPNPEAFRLAAGL